MNVKTLLHPNAAVLAALGGFLIAVGASLQAGHPDPTAILAAVFGLWGSLAHSALKAGTADAADTTPTE